MSTLQIDLDDGTADALASLAAARGTAPSELVAEIVAQYVVVRHAPDPPPDRRSRQEATQTGSLTGDPLDAIVGSVDIDPVDDIDEVNRALTGMSIDELRKRLAATQGERWFPQPDPIDALVGSLEGDAVNDIDEVVYGR